MFMVLDIAAKQQLPVVDMASTFAMRQTRMNENKNKRMLWVNHIERIRDQKDQTAFAELFEHFAPRIKGFLIKSGANLSLAEECSQEVMATCWHKAHMFDPSRASVATWIFTIARKDRKSVV